MSGMPADASRIRRRCVFHGRVQGVGFRATTSGIARRHSVAGYVRNQPDGTVELVLDGKRDSVSAMLDEISEAMRGCIAHRDDEDVVETDADFEGFEIRR